MSVLALPASRETFTGRIKAHGGELALAVVIVLITAFSVFLIYNEDPWVISRFIVTGIAYLAALILSIVWLGNSRVWRKTALILGVGTFVVLGGVYALSAGNGYPVNNVINSTSYSCSSSSGPNSSSYGCTEHTYPVQDIAGALGFNLLAWLPLIGCVFFSMPVWSEGAPKYYGLTRLIGGSATAAAILLNLVGIQAPGNLLSTPTVRLPLNPYLAYRECDSVSADAGCAFVNQPYVLADYALLLAAVVLVSFATSAFISHRMSARVPNRKAVKYSMVLGSVPIVGFVVIPASIAASGVLVFSGNSFTFSEYDFVRMPFVVTGHSETLTGAFQSSAPADLYILKSSQFDSFDSDFFTYLCPMPSFAPILANFTRGSIATNLGSGSYDLLFCVDIHSPHHPTTTQVKVTSPVKLSSLN